MTSLAEFPSAETADGQLVRAYLAGDEQAFETLYRRYFPDIRRFLHGKTHDLTMAEDLAQETLVRALRYLHTFDPGRPFWPWLKTIATNLLATERQRRAGEVLVEEVDRGVGLSPDGSDAVVSRDAVIHCLNKLPKRQSRALIMRYVEDRDSNDIAALFDLSRNALEQLILRGKTGFKREYSAQNGAPLLPGFAALLAKVRRVLAGIETRVNTAVSSPVFSASDLAIGAALTVSGIGIVAASFSPASTPVVEALGGSGAARVPITSVPGDVTEVGDVAANDRDVRMTAAAATDVAAAFAAAEAEAAAAAAAEEAAADRQSGGTSSPSGGGAPAAEVKKEVEEQKPAIKGRTPSPPEPKPTDASVNQGVGVEDVAGASVNSETTTAGPGGSTNSTSATITVLAEEETISAQGNLGDNSPLDGDGDPLS